VSKPASLLLLLVVLVLSSLGIADVYIFLLPYSSNWPVIGDVVQWMVVLTLFACACVVANAAEKHFRQDDRTRS